MSLYQSISKRLTVSIFDVSFLFTKSRWQQQTQTTKMADGGDAVDSGGKIICNICEEAGLNATASYFCVSCEQYLCEECKQYHSRVKATKSHQVIGTDEIPSLSSLILGSEASETPLCREHEQAFKYFCVSHMTGLCQTCRLMEHKTCSKVVSIETAANDVFTEGHSKNIQKSMEEIIDCFSKCKHTAQGNKTKLYKNKHSAIDNVKQARKTIDDHLDKIEAAAYEKIDRIFKTEMKQVEDQLHVCDVSISQLQKRMSKLEREMSLDDKESEFIIINNVTKAIKRQCDLLKDIIEENCDIDFAFEQSSSIVYLTHMMSSLGKVSVTKSPVCKSDSRTVAIYTGEIKIRTTTDANAPLITSYEVLPDGRHLLVDALNKKLKFYDSNNQFLSELVLPDTPHSVVLLSDIESVVSLPDIDLLQYITISKDHLTRKDKKKVNYRPVAMVKYGDDILAIVFNRIWKVAVIDKHGNIKRTIYQDNGSLFSKPYNIDLSVDQKVVYVVDEHKGCVRLSTDGNVVFQYRDQKVEFYGGLAVDRDCLFIGVSQRNSYSVLQLGLSDDAVADLDLGGSSPLKIKDNKLIIFKRDDRTNFFINILCLL